MLRTIVRSAIILVSIAAPLASAVAADDTKVIDAVVPEVAEVASGGSWSADKNAGFYRALVLMSGGKEGLSAHVYLQWLAFSEGSPIPTIVKTVPIKEVNDQNLANASISIEGEEGKDNEITLVVSSYDIDADKDINLFVKAGQPGNYSMSKAPPKSAPAAGGKEAPGEED
jgi:hypothetical protein